MNTGRVFCHASRKPLGGSGSLRNASRVPTSRSAAGEDLAHAERDALRRAEKVGEHRNGMSLRPLEQQRRPARAQHAVADLRHLELRIDLDADAPQLAARLELLHEIAQIGVLQRAAPCTRRGAASRLQWTQGANACEVHGAPILRALARRTADERRVAHALQCVHGDQRRSGLARQPFPARTAHRLRHRARELRAVLLPSHGSGRDRRRADPGLLDQRCRARHARRDLLLRLHAAADSCRGARRHAGAAAARHRRLARGRGRLVRLRPRAGVGSRGARAHAGRHRRGRCVHRDPQGQCRVVPGKSLRHRQRRDDVRRQSRRGARRCAARVDRDAGLVARRVRGPRRAVARDRARDVAQGARPAAGPRLCGRAPAARTRGAHAMARGAREGAPQSGHVARLLRQHGRRRNLPGIRRTVVRALPAGRLRHVTRARQRSTRACCCSASPSAR